MPNFEQAPAQEVPENEATPSENLSNLIDDEIKRFDSEAVQNKIAAEDIKFSIDEEIGNMNEEGSEAIEFTQAEATAIKEIHELNKDQEDKKQKEFRKKMNTGVSNIMEGDAVKHVESGLWKNIDNAIAMIDSPASARMLLMQEAIDKLIVEQIPSETLELAKTNKDVASLVQRAQNDIEAYVEKATMEALSEKMEEATDPAEISKYNKLIEVVEEGN